MSKTRIAVAYLSEHQHGIDPNRIKAILGNRSDLLHDFASASGIAVNKQALDVFVLPVSSGAAAGELAKAFHDNPQKGDIRILCYDRTEKIDFSILNGNRLLVAIELGGSVFRIRSLPCSAPGCIIECPENRLSTLLTILRLEFALARSSTLRHILQNEAHSQAERSLFLQKATFVSQRSALVAPTDSPSYSPIGVLCVPDFCASRRELLETTLRHWDQFIMNRGNGALVDASSTKAITKSLAGWKLVGGQMGARQAGQLKNDLASGANLIVRLSKSISARSSPAIKGQIQSYFRKHVRVNEVRAFDGFAAFNDLKLRELLREEWLSATRVYVA